MGIRESKSIRVFGPLYHAEEKNNNQSDVNSISLKNQFLPVYTCNEQVTEKTFLVDRIISNGAFGDVLKVKCILDDKTYAMKMMKKSQLIANEAVQQAKDEATIQESVSFHERIVTTFWFFQSQESIFIVMEYLSGGELFEFWKNTKFFDESVVKIYIAEMALVLDFLHDFGIIYRDLKLENILLDERGHLKLTDFGLAKRLRKGQRTRTICGTLHYIAPEIAEGGYYGHKSDWWSLGILAYVLLVGQFPLSGVNSHTEMYNQMLATNYTIPHSVPCDMSSINHIFITAEIRNLVSKLLEFNENVRFCCAKDLQYHPAYKDMDFAQIYSMKMPLPIQHSTSLKSENIENNFQDFEIDISHIPPNMPINKPTPVNQTNITQNQKDYKMRILNKENNYKSLFNKAMLNNPNYTTNNYNFIKNNYNRPIDLDSSDIINLNYYTIKNGKRVKDLFTINNSQNRKIHDFEDEYLRHIAGNNLKNNMELKNNQFVQYNHLNMDAIHKDINYRSLNHNDKPSTVRTRDKDIYTHNNYPSSCTKSGNFEVQKKRETT